MKTAELDLLPMGTRIIVNRKELKQVGRIYLPDNNREMEPTEGTVLSIGPDVVNVAVGDSVYYGRYSGFKFDRNGGEYLCMNEEDVIAKVKGGV